MHTAKPTPAVGHQQRNEVPVLVLTGDADAGRKNKLMEVVPSAKQVIVPNAGHVSNLENPKGFTDAVVEFISEVK